MSGTPAGTQPAPFTCPGSASRQSVDFPDRAVIEHSLDSVSMPGFAGPARAFLDA
jgi:hypothetical protein